MSPILRLIWFDRAVTGGIVFLILATPLAFGSVHPWAFAALEAVIFLLMATWMARLVFAAWRTPDVAPIYFGALPLARKLALPLVLFFAFILFQLLPLPPGLLQWLSPSTFEVYRQSLPGWPGQVPYAELIEGQPGAGSGQLVEVSGQRSVISIGAIGGRRVMEAKPAESSGQRSEVGGQRSEIGVGATGGRPITEQKSAESREQKSEIGGQRSDSQEQGAARREKGQQETDQGHADVGSAPLEPGSLPLTPHPSSLPPSPSPLAPRAAVLLPTPAEVRSGVPIPFDVRAFGDRPFREQKPAEVGSQRSEVGGQDSRLTPYASPLPEESKEQGAVSREKGQPEVDQSRAVVGSAPVAPGSSPLTPHASSLAPHATGGRPVTEQKPEESGGQRSEVGGQRSEVGVKDSRLAPHASRLTPSPSGLTPFPETWMPLSLAPSRTASDLLKLAAYGALFFLVLLYPFAITGRQKAGAREINGGPWWSKDRPLRRSDARSPDQQATPGGPWLRVFLGAIIFAGLVVATLGLAQRFSWNGKILWFFLPFDWDSAQSGLVPRASGPFINPDHFANYLALIFPLALGLVFYQRPLAGKRSQGALKIFCGLTAFLAFGSILLSLSRSGWMIACLGAAILFWLSPARIKKGEAVLAADRPRLALRRLLAAVAVLLIVSLFFVGPGGREQVDARVNQTVRYDLGLAGRAELAADTLKMIGDFPVLGVGLGSWQDLFQRYRRAPWLPTFYREAHNDYLELFAETGVVGVLLLAWFFGFGGKRLFAHSRSSHAEHRAKALTAMLLAALGAMAFHALLDFSLQIPANALLFTLLFAIAVRVAVADEASPHPEAAIRKPRSALAMLKAAMRMPQSAIAALPYAGLALAIFLCGAALNQEMIPYPYSLRTPGAVAEAKSMILAHPALSTPHLYLLGLLGEQAPPDLQASELQAALWLNPTHPAIRDGYALAMLQTGRKDAALEEISRSVRNAPSLAAHYYLSARFLPWLSDEEMAAVEAGFKQALDFDYAGAPDNLGGFYAQSRRFFDQARLYEQLSGTVKDRASSVDLLVKASASYLQDGKEERAEALLRKAATVKPQDPRPYKMLAGLIYGPRKDADSVRRIIAEGMTNGAPTFDLQLAHSEGMQKAGALEEAKQALATARESVRTGEDNGQEPFRLYLSVAETALRLGFRPEAEAALLQCLELRPSSSEILQRLGTLYLQQNKFTAAAFYLRQYLDFNPDAAPIFYSLALAEEGQYHFAAAEAAYKRALELAPEQAGYRQRYESFKTRVADNRSAGR